MTQSSLVKRQNASRAKEVATAAGVLRIALTDILDAQEGESLKDALHRVIDQRIHDERDRHLRCHHAPVPAPRPWWRFWA